jgi:dihydroxyacetone kinase
LLAKTFYKPSQPHLQAAVLLSPAVIGLLRDSAFSIAAGAAGTAAEQGASLQACAEIAERMRCNMRTLAVAVRIATHPSTGRPIFELGDDEMEIGMGQHGEAGNGRMKLMSADETASIMLGMLAEDLAVIPGEELLLNGTGVCCPCRSRFDESHS